MEEMISIPEVMFYPARMRKRHFLDEVLSTLTTEPLQHVDLSVSEAVSHMKHALFIMHIVYFQLTKYMFRAGNPFGVDLAAINIQRGRDHGLRPYNDYRELVGQPRVKNFDEFGPEVWIPIVHLYVVTEYLFKGAESCHLLMIVNHHFSALFSVYIIFNF